ARAALPSGVYRWGEVELAVDDARRIGWRRTSVGLDETAAVTAEAWARRYAELDLDATRALAGDDIPVALAYLPVWTADPAHYAAYFTVRSQGAHQVAL